MTAPEQKIAPQDIFFIYLLDGMWFQFLPKFSGFNPRWCLPVPLAAQGPKSVRGSVDNRMEAAHGH